MPPANLSLFLRFAPPRIQESLVGRIVTVLIAMVRSIFIATSAVEAEPLGDVSGLSRLSNRSSNALVATICVTAHVAELTARLSTPGGPGSLLSPCVPNHIAHQRCGRRVEWLWLFFVDGEVRERARRRRRHCFATLRNNTTMLRSGISFANPESECICDTSTSELPQRFACVGRSNIFLVISCEHHEIRGGSRQKDDISTQANKLCRSSIEP